MKKDSELILKGSPGSAWEPDSPSLLLSKALIEELVSLAAESPSYVEGHQWAVNVVATATAFLNRKPRAV